jgi:DNA sulfur modification protein DndD
MHFERLEILNFASYYGEHSLDLGCNPDCPVVIILGGTGYGKTTLFDAVNWALYGTDYERDLVKRRERQIIDYVNESALRDVEATQSSVEMSCTLYFEHEGVHYYINQALVAQPVQSDEGKLTPIQTNRTTALYEITSSGDHKRLKYDTIFLDEVLPNNVKDYFLFDGDRIYNLSNPGASQEVREAIFRVVDLELIKNAIGHLSDVATEYRRVANRESTGELSVVEEKYANAHERLSQLKAEEENLKEEERAIKAQIEALEEKLKNLPDTSRLQERRSQFIQQLQQVEADQESVTAEIRTLCATVALAFAREPILNLANEIDSKRQKGLIPKKVSQALLKDLLELKRCICGTEFQEEDQIFQALTARLEAERAKSSGQELLELLFQLRTASDLVGEAVQQLNEKDGELQRLQEHRRELDIAIKQIDSELEKLPKEDVAALTSEVKERRNAQISIVRKLQQAADRIAQCQDEIKEYGKKREALSKKQENVQKLQRRERLAQRAADELEEIYETFAEDSRQAVEDLTKQEFRQFVQSAAAYQVALNEEYELQVLDSHGNRALQRLSMGQSQCLSLAFITAISRVSEKNPPLVIDMPFGRLDRDVHDEVSTRLPEITSQLILFLIPEIEWNEVTAKNLQPQASHIYRLEFDKANRETTITKL